jgi:hypothetical protein
VHVPTIAMSRVMRHCAGRWGHWRRTSGTLTAHPRYERCLPDQLCACAAKHVLTVHAGRRLRADPLCGSHQPGPAAREVLLRLESGEGRVPAPVRQTSNMAAAGGEKPVHWADIQQATFTRWCNDELKSECDEQ